MPVDRDISVVVPTYNRSRWVRRAVDSLLKQTPPPLEVIIVDDGSSDSTPQVCQGLAGDTVRYIRQENQGPSAARNHGVALAKGQFLAFLDSDDLALPGRLWTQREAIVRFPDVQWSFCDHVGLDYDDEPLQPTDGLSWGFIAFKRDRSTPENLFSFFPELNRDILTAAGVDHTVYWGDFFRPLFKGNFVSPSGFMCLTSAFRETGGFRTDWRVAEDTEFFHRMAATSPGCAILTPLFGWRKHLQGGLVSQANVVDLIRNGIESMDSALHLRGTPSPEILRLHSQTLIRDYRALAYTLLSEIDRTGARDTVREAFGRFPQSRRDARLRLLQLASLVPASVLRIARSLKSKMAGGGRPDPPL